MTGIVILNYNNSSQTLECVKTLQKCCSPEQGREPWKLCVVDNASAVQEYEKLLGHDLTVLRSEVNGGYARGNNIGCEYFAADHDVDKILILNDDTRFVEDILTPMAAYLDEHAQCGVVFPKVVAPDGTLDKACWRVQKTTRDLVMQATSLPRRLGLRRREFLPTDLLTADVPVTGFGPEQLPLVPPGSCMMLRKADFQRIGWLDPNTFLYFEEHILLERLKRAGLSSALLPAVSIVHLGAATTASQPSKAIYKHWRNSYLYFMRNYSRVCRPLQWYLKLRTYLKTL